MQAFIYVVMLVFIPDSNDATTATLRNLGAEAWSPEAAVKPIAKYEDCRAELHEIKRQMNSHPTAKFKIEEMWCFETPKEKYDGLVEGRYVVDQGRIVPIK